MSIQLRHLATKLLPLALLLLHSALVSAQTPVCPRVFADIPVTEDAWNYSKQGYFVRATDAEHEKLGETFRSAGVIKPLQGEIERVKSSHLAVDLNRLAPEKLKQLRTEGRKELPKLYYFTSGAGLWSRGGGQVKALIPFNVKELLSPQEFALLSRSGDIANAADPQAVLKLAGRELKDGENAEKIAATLVEDSKRTLSSLIAKARANPEAITPIDMKLVNVAIQSDRASTYIPFDIWTSEQTHQPISDYLNEFRKTFRSKRFHPDHEVDAKIKMLLGNYLTVSGNRGETHLFGYQVGYHALDPNSATAVKNTATIGEGAGMAKSYLDESGRTRRLKEMGKSTWVFENIEVVTDLPVAMAAHARSKKPVSVILVPEKEGYKGGSPFLIKKEGAAQANLELHEQSALPPEFASGNEYFNSNTIFQSLDLAPPKNIGFEVKNSGTGKIVRAKMNAGDITQEAPTAGIGGRIGVEYENFKNYGEFGTNGPKLIDTFRRLWTQDLN